MSPFYLCVKYVSATTPPPYPLLGLWQHVPQRLKPESLPAVRHD
jgi:hypothetical protein